MPNIAENRKVRHDYEILEKLEAGLALTGPEVKSAKGGRLNLKGAFITFLGDRPMLTNAHIAPYGPAGPQPQYDPTRSRPLLLHKKQVKHLRARAQEAGLTIVPLSVYTKHHLIKVEVAVARGKKQYDKRAAIKKRDLDREIKRTLKM
jgi:SsrA-binding protein